MDANISRTRRGRALSVRGSFLLIALVSLGVMCVLLALSPIEKGILLQVLRWGGYLVPLLNWLPVLFCMLLFFFIFSNVVAAVAVPGFVFVAMGVVNRIKVELRGDPLLHWDFSLIREVFGVLDALSWQYMLALVLALFVFACATVLLGIFLRSPRLRVKARLAGAVLCLAVMLGLNYTLYSSSALEKSLPTWGSFYNMADVHASKGNLYEFIYNWNTAGNTRPEGYDANRVRAFIDAYADKHPAPEAEPAVRPHIVMVMGEAFSGLSQSEAVDFSGHRDPMAVFNALGGEGITGQIVVPSRGGGTADTEFDVLTARPSRYLRGAPYAYRMLAGPIEAMPSLLQSLGYHTLALHPGYPWFYNRQNVYPMIGFDEAVFEDAFAPEAYLDTFISEEATFDMLLSLLDTHFETSPQTPLFAFCLTIQNHAAYEDRYLPSGVNTFTPTVPMTETEQNILSNYFAGVLDADAALQRLADRLDDLAEPALIVYFGDHLPSMDETIYDKLIPGADAPDGSAEKETRLHAVPFMIWGNAAAREMSLLDNPADLPEDSVISSHYLGAYVLELLGFDQYAPYMSYVNALRAEYPILMEHFAFDLQGNLAQTETGALGDFRRWVYYRAYDE